MRENVRYAAGAGGISVPKVHKVPKLLDMQRAEYQPSPFTSVVPNMDSAEVAKSSASLAYSSLPYGSEVYWAIAL